MLESELDDGVDLDGLPDDVDRAAVKRMQVVAWVLDDAVRVPGTNYRVGIDPILGVLPVGGDTAAALVSLYIVGESARLGVARGKLAAMLVNILVDAGIGSIPALGTLFDAGWKANTRNLALALEDLTVTEIDVSGD